MPWNLPKSWSLGFALPPSVEAEGLERHAFVTQQQPDGTYDNPSIDENFTGFNIPKYIRDEGYGRGVYVTKWAPRGTYYGPRIPHWLDKPPNTLVAQRKARGGGTAYTVQPLSGDIVPAETPLPAEYQRYGDRTSAVIMNGVQKFPPKKRRAAIQRVLSALDPTLWGRTATIAKKYERAGMASDVALETGLARAMGASLLAETAHATATGKISKVGHLAIARRVNQVIKYGHHDGMGALPVSNPNKVTTGPASILPKSNDSTVTAAQMVQCGPFMFPAADEITVINIVEPNQPVFTNVNNAGAVYNASTGTMTAGTTGTFAGVSPAPQGVDLAASGNFLKLPAALNVTLGSAAAATFFSADAQALIVSVLSKDCSFSVGALAAGALVSLVNLPLGVAGFAASKPCIKSSMVPVGTSKYGGLADFLPNLPSKINQDYIYLQGAGTTESSPYQSRNGGSPIIATNNPANGKDYGVFLVLGAVHWDKPWGADPDPTKNNPIHLSIIWAPMEKAISKDWLQNLIAYVMHIAAEIIDIAVDIAGFVASEACQVLAGQATAGGAIARQICTPPPPPMMPTQDSLLVPLALLGVGGLLVVAAAKKRKKAV